MCMYDFDGAGSGGVEYSSLLDNVANLSILKRYDDTGLTQKMMFIDFLEGITIRQLECFVKLLMKK